MDNIASKLLDFFKHISREIFIYFTGGFVVILNLFLIDYLYMDSNFLSILILIEYKILLLFIISYIFGHIIMGIMYIVFELSPIDKYIIKKYKIGKINKKIELEVFKKSYSIYEYFIERENQLYYFRWILSGAFFVSLILNIIIDLFCNVDIPFSIYCIEISFFFIMIILHYKTAKEYSKTLKEIKEIL